MDRRIRRQGRPTNWTNKSTESVKSKKQQAKKAKSARLTQRFVLPLLLLPLLTSALARPSPTPAPAARCCRRCRSNHKHDAPCGQVGVVITAARYSLLRVPFHPAKSITDHTKRAESTSRPVAPKGKKIKLERTALPRTSVRMQLAFFLFPALPAG